MSSVRPRRPKPARPVGAAASALPLDAAAALHRSVIDLFRWLRAGRPPDAMGLSRLGLLAHLLRHGAASAGELAGYLHMQPQSMTRMLADLERQGLIRRRQDADDRRRAVLELTRSGAERVRQDVQQQRQRLAAALHAALTPAEVGMLEVAAQLMVRLAHGDLARTQAPTATRRGGTAKVPRTGRDRPQKVRHAQ